MQYFCINCPRQPCPWRIPYKDWEGEKEGEEKGQVILLYSWELPLPSLSRSLSTCRNPVILFYSWEHTAASLTFGYSPLRKMRVPTDTAPDECWLVERKLKIIEKVWVNPSKWIWQIWGTWQCLIHLTGMLCTGYSPVSLRSLCNTQTHTHTHVYACSWTGEAFIINEHSGKRGDNGFI